MSAKAREGITFEEYITGKFSAKYFNGSWWSENELQWKDQVCIFPFSSHLRIFLCPFIHFFSGYKMVVFLPPFKSELKYLVNWVKYRALLPTLTLGLSLVKVFCMLSCDWPRDQQGTSKITIAALIMIVTVANLYFYFLHSKNTSYF